MKLSKNEVFVFIENEAHLQHARELLERYGEKPCFHTFTLGKEKSMRYMYFNQFTRDWEIYIKTHEKQITLSELEQILKDEYEKRNFN